MLTLALDTTTAGSVAVLGDGEPLVERPGRPEQPHATRLPGDLLDALAAAGRSLDDVTLLAVASGPGAFTGLRIGIATMQGLAFARALPLIGVSALDALADAVRGEQSAGASIIACMDAARGEVFGALYEADTTPRLVSGPVVGRIDQLLSLWDPLIEGARPVIAGDGGLRYRDALVRWREGVRIVEPTPLLARWIGRRALDVYAAGTPGLPHAIQPLYVRRPDAEIARDRAAALPKG